jgi:hypothetical protein
MVIVYWQRRSIYQVGAWSIAQYDSEQDMYPVDDIQDRSWWIVPGTLED